MDMYQDVKEFMVAMEQPIPARPMLPPIRVQDLRWDLIDEEVNREYKEAYNAGNLVELADAIADSIYVLLGAAIAYGIDLRPVWAEVQRTNMAKVGGPVTPEGKRLKPPGWVKPDITRLLRLQGAAV